MSEPIIETSSAALADLNPYYKNARRGDIDAIAESLKTLGQFKPLVVNLGTLTGRPNEILAGNHTAQAATKIGLENVQVAWVDVDEETATKIVVADNRTSDLSSYDNDALADLLGGLQDYTGTGFSHSDYTRLLPKPAAGEDEWTDYKVPNFVVSYQLVFDDEAQQAIWHAYLRWLKANRGEESIGSRLTGHLTEVMAADGEV
jgi:ParB-like nuclease domain